MKKLFLLSAFLMLLAVSCFAVSPIDPHGNVCVGQNTTLHDPTPGGVWTSSATSIASVGSITGVVTGVHYGTATITYDVSGTYVTSVIMVDSLPGPITPPGTICIGAMRGMFDTTTGGEWTSNNTSIATIDSFTGVMTPLLTGVVTISYTLSTGCYATTPVTVAVAPSIMIAGPSTVCVGTAITDSIPGGYTGTWSSSNTAIATVSGGVVTGVSAGTAFIYFLYSSPCGYISATKLVTVTSTPSPGTITGTSILTAGSFTPLYDATPGGVWSSSNTAIADIFTSGVWDGVSPGTATISYTVTGCGGSSYATKTVTVNPYFEITGDIHFTGTYFNGPVKVYLITYNPGTLDLEAYDSTIIYCHDTVASYQFVGARTDSFRVKAAVDTPMGTVGYVPTYHTSSYYWYSATVFHHISGTLDANKDITMLWGTIPSGPGFIGGNVGTGANKGTSGGAAGLNVYAIDGSGNVLVTTTDGSGNYSFSNLPLGTYEIFPEALNYKTTPISGLTLTTASPTNASVGFIQHTISMTIKPAALEVSQTAPTKAYVVMFPNPTSDRLNLVWNGTSKEKGDVTITDVTGREVYTTALDITNASGNAQVSLSGIANGDYIVTVKSASLNFSGKLVVQR